MSFIFIIYIIGILPTLKTVLITGTFGSILFIVILSIVRCNPFFNKNTDNLKKQIKINLYSLILFSIFNIIVPSKNTLTLMVGAYYTQELGKRYKGELTELGTLSYKALKKHLEQLGK